MSHAVFSLQQTGSGSNSPAGKQSFLVSTDRGSRWGWAVPTDICIYWSKNKNKKYSAKDCSCDGQIDLGTSRLPIFPCAWADPVKWSKFLQMSPQMGLSLFPSLLMGPMGGPCCTRLNQEGTVLPLSWGAAPCAIRPSLLPKGGLKSWG